MATHRLPSRIAAVMITTVVVFVLTVGATIGWMARALDIQARDHLTAQLGGARDNLLAQTRLLMLDYAKWEAAVPRIEARDMGWIRDNIGASAAAGISFQLAVLWGGPVGRDIGWTEGGDLDPQPDVIDAALLGQVEAQLRRIPLNVYDGTEFFAWHHGSLFVMGAARIEADAPAAVADLVSRDSATARILLGKEFSTEVLHDISGALRIERLELMREVPEGRSLLGLPGVDGRPVAFLAWTPPVPGTGMIWRMAPLLVAEIVLIMGLAGFGVAMLRRGAGQLIRDERNANEAARTDALTGLPNRAALFEALGQPVRAGQRAVVFLDVNGFKAVNDSLGHAAGDEVIVRLARRLDRLGASTALLARIGGDEFVFLLSGPDVAEQLPALIQKIHEAFETPFEILGRTMHVSCALGSAIQHEDGADGEELLRDADLAMYEAKRQGRAGDAAARFGAAASSGRDDWLVERELRGALDGSGELVILYQPVVKPNRRLAYAEATVHWNSPTLGEVPPERFLAVAERAGLMPGLGRQVVRLVCADLAHHPLLRASLKISLLQLVEPEFIPGFREELGSWDVDPGRIQVELGKTALQDDGSLAAERIGELSRAGVAVVLSSSGLTRPNGSDLLTTGVRAVKLGRTLVAGYDRSWECTALLGEAISRAHAMGLQVVCDGVDTREEADALARLGCDLVQGACFDPPLPIEMLMARWVYGPARRIASAR